MSHAETYSSKNPSSCFGTASVDGSKVIQSVLALLPRRKYEATVWPRHADVVLQWWRLR
jgi:hypothetical protein